MIELHQLTLLDRCTGPVNVYQDQRLSVEYFLVNGVENGTRFNYDSGVCILEESIADGMHHGVTRHFNRSGGELTNSFYLFHERFGQSNVYGKNGQLISETNYIYGVRHGASIHYHTDGSLALADAYFHGLEHAQVADYFHNSILSETSIFVLGESYSSVQFRPTPDQKMNTSPTFLRTLEYDWLEKIDI